MQCGILALCRAYNDVRELNLSPRESIVKLTPAQCVAWVHGEGEGGRKYRERVKEVLTGLRERNFPDVKIAEQRKSYLEVANFGEA